MSGAILPQLPQSSRDNFPGMIGPERAVLRAWLKLHEQEYTRFEYNTPVGNGTPALEGVEEALRRMWELSTKKKIDVIAWQGRQATVIEVKQRAKISAAGQVHGYALLWQREHPELPAPKQLVIASRIDNDALPLFSRLGVEWETVAADFGR